MTCKRCNHTARKFGRYGKRHIQRYRCTTCNATFSEYEPKLGTHYTDPETASKALAMMLEGMSVRAISRLTGLHKGTILSLMLTAAQRAEAQLNSLVRNVRMAYLQADELWCFVGKKQRRIRTGDSPELGDQWAFVALDAETKLIVSCVIGKRTVQTTHNFLADLKSRIADARFQLTTDGFHFYERGVEDVFAGQADFAQLVKLFGDYGQFDTSEARYSPPRITEVISKIRDGRPDPEHISTSYVERSNLTLRMHLRRYTRLTNAFSKKLDNLKAAVTLYVAFYNFCRVHQTLRVTPAMEAALTDHTWTLNELLA
ncbi:MAG: IS1 family transposase [Candidatus Korobacteraceae bacterium]|jgi:IS1 family transposase/transposase-like protein